MSFSEQSNLGAKDGGPSFPLHHRVFRAVWNVTWLVLGTWTPVPFHGWRRFLLSSFGARLDKTSRVYPGVTVWYPPNLKMGAQASMGPGVICYCVDRITLSDYANISQRAHLCGATHDQDDANFPLVAKPIFIGKNAWIAAEAFVGPGVSVGDGAVLGARAVTVKNLEDYTIYVGNPARAIRKRQKIY